nr:hypothetical protein [Tanacetum cinerariifolium]
MINLQEFSLTSSLISTFLNTPNLTQPLDRVPPALWFPTRLPAPPLPPMLKQHASSCQCCQNTTRTHEELRVFKEETSLIPFDLIKHYTNGCYPRRIFEAYSGDMSSGKAFPDDISSGKGISSGSTTTHSGISLSDYEAFYFYDDHIEEISSGSTTTHSDISFFDRSDFTHEEFADELAHIISPPEYDCFYFRNLPDLGFPGL